MRTDSSARFTSATQESFGRDGLAVNLYRKVISLQEDFRLTTELNHIEPSAAQPQPKKIRNGILAAKNAKDAKKESGFVGVGLKPALLDLAHREICARRANYHG